MLAVGADHVVVLVHGMGDADADSLLTAVEVQETAHLALAVELGAGLLEFTDAGHLAVHLQQFPFLQK